MTIVALRLIMQWVHWDYHNPIAQLIVKATKIPVTFLRGFIPAVGKWDSATIILLVLLAAGKLILIALLQSRLPHPFVFILFTLAELFSLFITIFTVSIIIEVVLSWLSVQGSHHPISSLINRMNAPLLKPFRKLFPDMSGIDLSPLFAILALQILSMLIMPILTGQY
jgi:YggT family protein